MYLFFILSYLNIVQLNVQIKTGNLPFDIRLIETEPRFPYAALSLFPVDCFTSSLLKDMSSIGKAPRDKRSYRSIITTVLCMVEKTGIDVSVHK